MLKPSQVADLLNVRPGTVSNWITRGLTTPDGKRFLAATRAGKSWRIRQEDLDLFLDMEEPAKTSPAERKKSSEKKAAIAEVESLKRFLGMI